MTLTPLLLVLRLLLGQPATTDIVARQVDEAIAKEDSLSMSPALSIPYFREIASAANTHDLPPALLAGIIQEESRFSPWATRMEPRYVRSRKVRSLAYRWSRIHANIPNGYTELTDRSRSYGLMQVMGETAREQGFDARYLSELYVPRNAIEHGARLLRRLLLRYHNDTLAAISAYNQGSARKRRGLFVNARYVYRVTLAWRAYEAVLQRRGGQPDRAPLYGGQP